MTRVHFLTFMFIFVFSFIALGTLCPIGSRFCPKAHKEKKFSDDFLWGAASSAYQIEGAWNVDGKQNTESNNCDLDFI